MSRLGESVVVIFGKKLAESGKAVQFQVHLVGIEKLDPPMTSWFPFSQMHSQYYDPDPMSEMKDKITITEWMARQKGLIS